MEIDEDSDQILTFPSCRQNICPLREENVEEGLLSPLYQYLFSPEVPFRRRTRIRNPFPNTSAVNYAHFFLEKVLLVSPGFL